ncbi:MAG: protein translocase subunit SecF [Minisyncoccia bacterium]|jgi:preprotein translocase subunit SecF
MKPAYKIVFFISAALVIGAIISIAVFGLRFGVDFKGGSEIQLIFNDPKKMPSPDDLTKTISEISGVSNVSASPVGADGMIIRLNQIDEAAHQAILTTLNTRYGKITENSFDSIGPTVGQDLRDKSIWAIIILLLAIVVYMAIVFRKLAKVLSPWAMGIATIIALFHDILIPIGVFALLGHFMGVEITGIFVAAILTILGYSVSDSVVVLDRVRENVLRFGSKEKFGDIVHKSIMQTLSRSLNTNLTTLLSLIAIFFFGGESVKYFALALIIGIFLGAYSSIFVASPLLVWWNGMKAFKR